jgi:hypothetical protein
VRRGPSILRNIACRRTRRYRVTVLTVSKSPLLTFEAKPRSFDLHRSMSLWLGFDPFTLVFGKRRVGNTVATRCASANVRNNW